MGFAIEGWTRRLKFTVPPARVGTGGVINYSMPFSDLMFDAAALADILAHARPDMGDLRVSTDAAGDNKVRLDLIHGSNSSGTAAKFYGRNGTVSKSAVAANDYYLFYGKADATAEDGTAAYHSSFEAYLPNGGVGTNRVTGTSLGTAIGGLSSGGIDTGPYSYTGSATDYNGSSQGLNMGSSLVTGSTARTVLAWIRPDFITGDRELFRISDVGAGEAWVLRMANSASGALRFAVSSGSVTSSLIPTASSWNMISLRHGTTNLSSAEFRLNGSMENASSSSVAINTSAGLMYVGTNEGSGNWFNGQVSEIQVHSEEKTDAWWTTEWNAGNSPATFVTNEAPVALATAETNGYRDVRARHRRWFP